MCKGRDQDFSYWPSGCYRCHCQARNGRDQDHVILIMVSLTEHEGASFCCRQTRIVVEGWTQTGFIEKLRPILQVGDKKRRHKSNEHPFGMWCLWPSCFRHFCRKRIEEQFPCPGASFLNIDLRVDHSQLLHLRVKPFTTPVYILASENLQRVQSLCRKTTRNCLRELTSPFASCLRNWPLETIKKKLLLCLRIRTFYLILRFFILYSSSVFQLWSVHFQMQTFWIFRLSGHPGRFSFLGLWVS